jgi:hypothetical protein
MVDVADIGANLNVADIGAKKRFNHVLRRICQGKCVLNLN